MLNESRNYSFLDQKEGFAIHFFEGQKLIESLAVIHHVEEKGLFFFRDAVLSFQPMVAFLKPNEGFGLYIDSEEPFLRLKIETGHNGYVRCLLLPEDIKNIPDKINGVARLSKVFHDGKKPYTSVIELRDLSLKEFSNTILKDSYQLDAQVFLSSTSDQSILIVKLPMASVDKEEIIERPTTNEYYLQNKSVIEGIFKQALDDEGAIQKIFEKEMGVYFLKSTQIKFKCSCSRERFVMSLAGLSDESKIELFSDGQKDVEVKCDYCKTHYLIDKREISH